MTRTAAYVRVSKETQGQVSPDAQRSEILSYCERKGWTVTEWFEDIDISGRTDKRPGLQAMLRRAQDGEFEAVVFYRIDRLSREPMHHYAILAALKEAGVAVDSVGLPLEDNPESSFMWDLSAALAKLESLRLGKRLRSMHAQLAREGKYASGPPPFGWKRIRDESGQRLVLEPTEADWRRRMLDWYRHGASTREIARRLNAAQVPTRRGGAWASRQVGRMLTTPLLIGARVIDGGFISTGRIEPLISEAEYQEILAITAVRSQRPHRPGRTSGRYPLGSTIMRCGTCGGPLYLRNDGRRMKYRCENRTRGRCSRGVIIGAEIVMQYVTPRLLRRLAHRPAPRRPHTHPVDLQTILGQQTRLEESLGRLAVLYSEGQLGEEEYQRARATQRTRLEAVRKRLEQTSWAVERRARALGAEEWDAFTAITSERWAMLPVETQRQICSLLIETVTVHPATSDRRIEIRWR